MYLQLYIKICKTAQSLLMQMHLKCLLLSYFYFVPFDKNQRALQIIGKSRAFHGLLYPYILARATYYGAQADNKKYPWLISGAVDPMIELSATSRPVVPPKYKEQEAMESSAFPDNL